MILSYYIFKYPYKLIWHLSRVLKKNPGVVVYCAEPIDYVVLEPVLKYLPTIPIIVKNRKTAKFLKEKGIDCRRLPSFPKAVIMSRHATHKFPEEKIIKIGFRHGAYHFKEFSKALYYNDFDIYFVTSSKEVELAKARAITSTKAIGFPKLDPAFDNTLDEASLKIFREKANINKSKKTVIFTATWDKSGMSAIGKWVETIHTLTKDYNILITIHSWTSKKYVEKLKKTKDIYFIDEPDVLPYLMLADVLVGDTSSIIAEFCTLNKPIVTFKVPTAKRTVPEIKQLLQDISIQIENGGQLKAAIENSLKNPEAKSKQRQRANQIMFDRLDGHAGKRASTIIKEWLSI